jgi:hypothetical protein
MLVVQTPSPFRLSRRTPSTRRNAGPQFAPTPRFVLSESANDDHDVIDDDEPSLTSQLAQNSPASQAAARSRHRDVIDDADDAAVTRDRGVRTRETDELFDDAINSTPPDEAETPGALDADIDALFPPNRSGNKRRRMDRGTPSVSMRLTQLDPILSSPPQSGNPPSSSIESPNTNRKIAPAWEMGTQKTPVAAARPFATPASTPGDMKTTFRGRPRFMLSSTMKPPSSQSAPKFKPNTPTISPPERRKPVFVLPRSPSPNPDAENIPAPFSPSSRTLNRRGRNRGVSNYIPGGMAAEVRSWVLEMGTRREKFLKPPLAHSLDQQTVHPPDELGKYQMAARVIHVSHSVLGGCGSLAFLQAEPVAENQLQGETSHDIVNILTMGPPRSKPDARQSSSHADIAMVTLLQEGDLVGIYRGLTWNLQIGDKCNQVSTENQIPNPPLLSGSSANDAHMKITKDWLVAMEWDLIQPQTEL